MKVQAVLGHPWASVGVLLSPRGVDESQAGVPRAGGVEEVDQGVAPPGVVFCSVHPRVTPGVLGGKPTRGGWWAPARGGNSGGVHRRIG